MITPIEMALIEDVKANVKARRAAYIEQHFGQISDEEYAALMRLYKWKREVAINESGRLVVTEWLVPVYPLPPSS